MTFFIKPDASRPLSAVGPFSVVPGRGIVDASGRLVARCHARESIGAMDGATMPGGFTPAAADDNAHALAAILNNPAVAFADHLAERIANAQSPADRDWLRRVLGNVRKMI